MICVIPVMYLMMDWRFCIYFYFSVYNVTLLTLGDVKRKCFVWMFISFSLVLFASINRKPNIKNNTYHKTFLKSGRKYHGVPGIYHGNTCSGWSNNFVVPTTTVDRTLCFVALSRPNVPIPIWWEDDVSLVVALRAVCPTPKQAALAYSEDGLAVAVKQQRPSFKTGYRNSLHFCTHW